MNPNSPTKKPALYNPSRPPLITPSASPPPWTTGISGRHPDTGLPPFKRSRASATPHPSPFFMSSAPSGNDPGTDFHKERQASAMRLLDVWSNLAERYTRRLDEDDIVDLRTLEIVKDNGVMRGIGKVDFGSISEAREGSRDEEEGDDDEEDNEDEPDVDELDTIPRADSEPYELEALETQIHAITMPLASSLHPVDAEDLQEFMEAEERRRELWGSEPEDDVERTVESSDANDTFRDDTEPSAGATGIEVAEESEGEEISDSASEDELGNNWGVDEASAIYDVVTLNKDGSDDDSDIEIIEGPVCRPNKVKSPEKKGVTNTEINLQLQTPPKSSSSIPSGSSPSSRLFSSLPPSSPPPRSPSPYQAVDGGVSATPPTSPAVLSSSPLKLPRARPQGSSPLKSGLSKANPLPYSTKTPQKTIRSQVNRSSESRLSVSVENEPSTLRSRFKTPTKGMKVVQAPMKSAEAGPSTGRMNANTPIRSSKNLRSEAVHCHDNAVTLKPAKNAEAGPSSDHARVKVPVVTSKAVHKESPKGTPKRAVNAEPSSSSAHTRMKTPTRASVKPEVVIERRKPFFPSKAGPEDPSEFDDLPPPPPKILRSTPSVQKRKRLSTSSESGDSPPQPRYHEAKPHKGKTKSHHVKRTGHNDSSSDSETDSRQKKPSTRGRSKSKPLHISSDSEESDFRSRDEYSLRRRSRSSQPPLKLIPPYPYMQPPSSAQHHSQFPPPVYPPIPDPRAQMIIAQAMQQLSALAGWGTPPGVPFTPSSRHGYSSPGLLYSTPTHHVFPYMFDPSMSNATLPPDSPNPQSSPESAPRKKSLVRRSRSRGRRVSFKVDGRNDDDFPDVQSSPIRSSLARKQMKKKGKAEAIPNVASDAEPTSDEGEMSELEVRQTRTRGQIRRGQTPGPASDGECGQKPRRRERKSLSVDAR